MELRDTLGLEITTWMTAAERRALFEAVFGKEAVERTARVGFQRYGGRYQCSDGRCVMGKLMAEAGVPIDDGFPEEGLVVSVMEDAGRIPESIDRVDLENAADDMIRLNDHGVLATPEAVKAALGL